MKEFITKIKRVTLKDIFHIFLFILAILPSIILKKIKKDIWLICETEYEARDNGYWLYRYIKASTDKQNVYYSINPKSPDYRKIEEIDEKSVITYGTFQHWVYYLAATLNISSHKGGKPNAAVCYFLEVYGFLKNKRVFLQHGITLSDAKWLYYNETKFRLFICASNMEYEFIKERFGYPDNNLKCLGFSRYDNLPLGNEHIDTKTILVMPSWRSWLVPHTPSYDKYNEGSFANSDYFQKWSSFLSSEELHDLLENRDYKLIFYPHRNIQPYIKHFLKYKNHRIEIASFVDFDVQELLIKSDILITDYSSVSLDFAYMSKPTIYYQFDYNKFRKAQYQEGYFKYEEHSLGYVTYDVKSLIATLDKLISVGVDPHIINRFSNFYAYRDHRNSKRIYQELLKIT